MSSMIGISNGVRAAPIKPLVKVGHFTQYCQVGGGHRPAAHMLANQRPEAVLLLRAPLAPHPVAIQELNRFPHHKLHWLHHTLTIALARMPHLGHPQAQVLVQRVLVQPVQLHIRASGVGVQNGATGNECSSLEAKKCPLFIM